MSDAIRSAWTLVGRCFFIALISSALTGFAASALLVLWATLSRPENLRADELSTAVVFLFAGSAIGTVVGLILAMIPTFLLGFAMAVLSLFQPLVRHPLAWAVVGGISGFFLIEISPILPPRDPSADDMVSRLLFALLGISNALLFRHWTMRRASELWRIIERDIAA